MARSPKKSVVVPSADKRVIDAWDNVDWTCDKCAIERGATRNNDPVDKLPGNCYFCGKKSEVTPVKYWSWPQIKKWKSK